MELSLEKYSFLISVYKDEHTEYLTQALDSMIGQTVPPDEIVLVEDGPLTDDLYRVIAEYTKKYNQLFTIVENKENLGLGRSLNRGLKVCRNELIARMDSDDICKPDRCEKQLKRFYVKPDLSIVGSYIDEFSGDVTNVISVRKVPTDCKSIYYFGKKRSAFNHPTVMYRKSAVIKCKGYRTYRRNQDVDLFGRMLFYGFSAENIDESLLWFRCSDELKKRRKSWENTWTYIRVIDGLHRIGYSSMADVIIVAIGQIGLFVMPLWAQELIYKKVLRR